MAARVPAPAAARIGRAQAQAAKAAEGAARALAAGGPRIELSPIFNGETERPTRELVNVVKEISKLVLTKGACYSAAMSTLSAAGWAASAFGEQLQTIITERRQIERTSEGTNAPDLLAFRSAWPKAVVDAMMRAVMPKSMHGLDLATCRAQLEPEKWAQKQLRVCAALELLATAADDKHKTLAKALMMVLADRHTKDSLMQARECGEESHHKMLQELGLAVAKSTRSGELSRLVAAEKALNDTVLELAPTWWLAFAAFDNLVALPKTNSNALATIQIFLFFGRPMISRASAGLHAPEHREDDAVPRWTDADEQHFAFCNFIFGRSAIEEELAALPRAPRLLQAAVQRVVTIGPKPDEQFVGAARFFQIGLSCCMQTARQAWPSAWTRTSAR